FFLIGVLIMVFIDSPLTMLVTAIASILMIAGWYACRTRIRHIAETRDGYTGTSPVIANAPADTFKK
ncbi:L-asparagine permease, partial [Pseudarthrobacter sp. YAF2]